MMHGMVKLTKRSSSFPTRLRGAWVCCLRAREMDGWGGALAVYVSRGFLRFFRPRKHPQVSYLLGASPRSAMIQGGREEAGEP
jgi:hypothetical protein